MKDMKDPETMKEVEKLMKVSTRYIHCNVQLPICYTPRYLLRMTVSDVEFLGALVNFNRCHALPHKSTAFSNATPLEMER